MNAEAPQKPPEDAVKPGDVVTLATGEKGIAVENDNTTESVPLSLQSELVDKLVDMAKKNPDAVHILPPGWQVKQPQGFIVRVPLVCPHCSSYMRVLPSGTVMTCYSERCPNHLKKFKLPVLYAEEVKE